MRPRFWLIAWVAFATACGSRNPGLRLTTLDSSVQKPSNVAVYFTVDTDAGEPVAGLTAEQFRIYEDGQLVSTFESKQTILNPEVAAEHFTLLLVDMSGSVSESGDVPAIVDAARAFSDRVGKYQRVAVYAFDGRPDIQRVSDFTARGASVEAGAARLDSFRTKDLSTNLNGAVIKGLEVLDRRLARADAPLRFGTLVIFTDGTDRAARVVRDDLMAAVDATEHEIYVIGVGAEIDSGELGNIGRAGVILTKDRAEIANAFEQAAARIEAMSQRYYLLGYCSPARAGVHEVTIEAVHDGKSGSLSYEFDAAGFRPDCDPTKPPRFSLKRPKPRVD
ncbi:MAG: VWA domain-containing protein [Kofleriaceae bacterium]|nr:MAG: VWA domain-containing protein [Kofleriaceae bacterium]